MNCSTGNQRRNFRCLSNILYFGSAFFFFLIFFLGNSIPGFTDIESYIEVKTEEEDRAEFIDHTVTPIPTDPLSITFTNMELISYINPPIVKDESLNYLPLDLPQPYFKRSARPPKSLDLMAKQHKKVDLEKESIGAKKGQLRLDLHSYVLNVLGGNENRNIFDISRNYKVLYGFGLEYLLTDHWGVRGNIDVGVEQVSSRNEEEGIRRTIFHANTYGVYHFFTEKPLDLFLDFGVGLVTSTISGQIINDYNVSELSIVNTNTQASYFAGVGLGINYFFTRTTFAGFEGLHTLFTNSFNRSLSSKDRIQMDAYSCQAKLGLTF